MIDVLVTGGAGFIGSNFVRHALEAHTDWRITTLDKLTYAGRTETLADVMDHPRHGFVLGDIGDAAVSAPLVERAEIVVHFAAETHVDRSIQGAGDFIRTDVLGTFVLLEAARRAPHLKRFVQISTDEVYGSVPTGASRETDELKPRNPVLGEQGRRGPPGVQLLRHLRRAGDRDARVEQLRAVPVSRESHSALRHQRDRRDPAAALRRRQAHPRLAARRGSLPRARPADREGHQRRGVQRRRRQRGRQRRPHAHDSRPRRSAADAHPSGAGSPGARSPVLARHLEGAFARLDAAPGLRRGHRARPSSGIGPTSGGGVRSRKRIPSSRPSTTRSTAAREP